MYPYQPNVPDLDPPSDLVRVRGRVLMQFRGKGPWTLLKTIEPCMRTLDTALDPRLWLDVSSQVFDGELEHLGDDLFAALGTTPAHSIYPGTRYRVELRIQAITHGPVSTS